jgi:hypothetical protein
MPKVSIAEPVKDKVDKAEESKAKKIMQVPKILSPPIEATLPKVQKASAERVECCAGNYEGFKPCCYKESY